MTSLTQAIEEIKARVKNATPGPWYPCGCRYTMISRDLNEQEIQDIAEVCNHFDDSQVESNKQLIAHAPTDITRLLAALECAVEALEFYTYEETWADYGTTALEDNGSEAREAQQKITEILGGGE